MQAKYPKNGEVLLQLQRLQVTLRDWPALIALLPQLRKQQVLRPQEQDDLERKVWIATLDEVPAQGAESAVDAQWQQVPTRSRAMPRWYWPMPVSCAPSAATI